MPRTYEFEDPNRIELINKLKEKGRKEGAEIWKSLAMELSRPRKNRRYVNIWKLNKYSKNGETIIVPGKILGTGYMDHKIGVAAFKFTRGAKKKIEEAGGRVMSIQELMKTNPKGSKVRIIG